ncbi:MFS transporter [Asaia spathodeae]|uniref:MFS transporter n=1 Tax=Asaia spathodeae TaxID=657016 RepID=A0ABX2P5U9_9PROT|nr:MFS transporter [Asaia spathodeae]GBR20561.1 transporter [Asaia spathodeae NBRC 105894]
MISHTGATRATVTDYVPFPYRSISIRIIPFLTLGFLAAYIDRVNVGFAKLQMAHDLHMSDSSFGLAAGLFFIGYVLCEIPSSLILARVGARRWLSRILISWGVLSMLGGLVTNEAEFLVSRIALGVAEAGFMPGALFTLAEWIPGARRSRAVAAFMFGIPAASIVGAPLSGLILTHLSGFHGLSGWRWLFILEGLPPVCLGLWGWLALPDSLSSAAWLTPEARQAAHEILANEASRQERDAGAAAAFRNPAIWLIGAIDGTILLGLYTIAFWLPSFLKERLHDAPGISFSMVGLMVAIPHIVGALAMLLVGWSADRQQERRWHLFLPLLAGGIALALYAMPLHGVTWLLVTASCANAGLLSGLPSLWALPSGFLKGRAAATGLATACSFANLAGFVATSFLGVAIVHFGGAQSIIWIFALTAILGGASVFLLPVPNRTVQAKSRCGDGSGHPSGILS